jgi:hypothetical protein
VSPVTNPLGSRPPLVYLSCAQHRHFVTVHSAFAHPVFCGSMLTMQLRRRREEQQVEIRKQKVSSGPGSQHNNSSTSVATRLTVPLLSHRQPLILPFREKSPSRNDETFNPPPRTMRPTLTKTSSSVRRR